MSFYFFVALSRYPIPPLVYSSERDLAPGMRVIVPVRNSKRTGYVVGRAERPDFRTREITEIVDETPILDEKMLELAREMADKYMVPVGEVLDLSFPPSKIKGTRPKRTKNRYITLKASVSEILSSRLGSRETELIEELLELDILEYAKAYKKFPPATIKALARKGFIEIVESEGKPDSRRKIELNSVQREIAEEILKDPAAPHLIYGVTGSGKTEVYFEIAQKIMDSGKKVLLLVPEISLTPQLLLRTRERFPERKISVYHSALGSTRKSEWDSVVDGTTDILLGTRSAVWLPMKDIGLVIVDEEQDDSYKQYAMRPYYNAVDVARRRAELEGAVFVLASATPRVETYYAAKNGQIRLHRIENRPFGEMPKISIVDMRHLMGEIVSSRLVKNMEEAARDGNQTFLFVPKKGFSTRVQCIDCGHTIKCPNCDVSLVYHRNEGTMKCHYCGYVQPLTLECPECGSKNLKRGGLGTERVEMEVSRIFPGLRIKRMDREEIENVQSLEEVLKDISQMKVDIVVGTKMIAKGLDFPRVALVGMVDADHSLGMPDFRATERTFHLIAQMAGRAGRGVAGKVVIQSRETDNPALKWVLSGNFEGFYEEEIERRRALGYPPFKELVLITSEARTPQQSKEYIESAKKALEGGPFQVLGPVESPIFKLISLYRYQILLKCENLGEGIDFLKERLDQKTLGFDPSGTLKIDVQPYSF